MSGYTEVNGVRIAIPTPPRNPRSCSMEELQEYLHSQAAYEDKVRRAMDGQVDEVQRDLETERRYSIPMDQLLTEAKADQKAREDQERDAFRTQNAYTFMAHEPRYKQTMKNAVAIENELNRLGWHGTVNDLKNVFEDLAAKGQLELNNVPPGPKKIYSADEFKAMAPEEMKDAIDQMHKDGIF